MEEQIVKNVTEKPNSYEFGKAGARHKLYYADAEDLDKQIKALVEKGYANEEDFKNAKS